MSLPVWDEAEIAVVGAGPAGSIAAFTLAELGHEVVLIDKRSFPREKACGDGLTTSAAVFLHEVGLERALAGAQPIDAVRVFVDWRERESVATSTGPGGGSCQACCIPRKRFDHALVEMACSAGARLVQGYVTQPLRGDDGTVGVELVRGAERMAIHARHVVAADGATSRLRRELGGKPAAPATLAYAVRQYVRSERPLGSSFEIYAPLPGGVLNYGYGWVFPVSEWIANVGVGYLSTPGLPYPRSISELLEAFLVELQRSQGDRLGSLDRLGRAIGGVFGGDFTADGCQLGGVVFAGDAAQTTDPLTGEGIDQAMRSAHTAALSLGRAIRRHERRVEVGRALGRANLRLGQDSSMMARLTHDLLKRRAGQSEGRDELLGVLGPLLATAVAMLTAESAHILPVATPVGELASRLGCADRLVALDERLRETIRSEFVLAAELLQREVCGGLGPVAALMVIASQLACLSEPDERSVDAALCAELLCAFPAMLSRASTASGPYASANNALAVMVGDYSLCRALAVVPDLGVEVSQRIGEAIEANSEGVAMFARDQGRVGRPVGRYLDWAQLTSGANLSLAAGLGAQLAGADPRLVGAFRSVGESLGLAVQICEDILALERDDPITGRHPRNVFEEGHCSLPIMLALEEDPSLADLVVGMRQGAEWDEVVELVRRGRGPRTAAEVCREYAEQAKMTAAGMVGGDSLLVALCGLPEHCLESRSLLAAA